MLCYDSAIYFHIVALGSNSKWPSFDPCREDPLEKEMATHSNMLAWEIPWTEEPGRLWTMGLQRVRHDLVTKQQQ